MKKISLFMFALLLFVISCQKENSNLNQQKIATFKLVDKPIVESLLSYKSEEDQKINLVCYLFAEAIKKASSQPEFVKFMYDEMKSDVYNRGQLLSMSRKNPQFGAFMAQALTASLYKSPQYAQKLGIAVPKQMETSGVTNDFDVLKLLDNVLIRRGISYDPIIYLIKDSASTSQKQPIIAIGRCFPHTNNVPAWDGDTEVQLSESDVQNHAGLLVFVGTGSQDGKAIIVSPNTSNETLRGTDDILRGNIIETRAMVTVVITQFQLKQDFDADNFNELRGFVTRYANSNTASPFWQAGFNEMSIYYNDIGTIFDPNPAKPFFAFADTDWNSKNFAFALYEYDWYASFSAVINDCTNNLNTSGAVRMTYDDQWFFKWCTTNYGSSFLSSSGSTATGENDKSKFILKRL